VPLFPKNREEALKLLRLVHGPDTPIADYLIDAMLNEMQDAAGAYSRPA
jgi:hypothetical protein